MFKRASYICLGILCLIGLGAYLIFYPPFPLIPPIGRGLPYTDNYDFSLRVNKAFPIGTPGDLLRKEFSKQGFIVAREPINNTIFLQTKFSNSKEELFNILISNGYLNKDGKFQDKFLKIKNFNELNLGPEYDSRKEDVFAILSKDARIWGARFTKAQFPCELHCIIVWREDANGKVEYLSPDLGRTCL